MRILSTLVVRMSKSMIFLTTFKLPVLRMLPLRELNYFTLPHNRTCQQALDSHMLIISTRIDRFPSLSQTHPNVDKKLFTAESVIGLKNPEKSFPLNNDVGVLKWRLQTTDESLIPLTSKWPCFTVLSSV